MKFTISRKDIAGEILELERSALSGRVKVIQGEKPLARLKEKHGPFDLVMADGTHRRLFVRARWLDPVPVVLLEQEAILLAQPLRFIDYIFACFPVLMFLIYGAFSTVTGFFLLMGNFRILRSKMRPSMKWAAIYAMDIAVFWLVIAIVKFVLAKGH
jgi:hypothetical protein